MKDIDFRWEVFKAICFVMLLAAILILGLAGCASTVEIPKEVKVPVPVPCVQERPQRPPLLSDAELLALDRYKRTHALWGDRIERQRYQSELETVVEGCSRIPGIKP